MNIKINPTDATLGATVTGVNLKSLNTEAWTLIENAFLKYALLIFPDQNLGPDAQVTFAKRFGEIENLVADMDTIPLSNKAANGRLMDDEEEHMKLLTT